MQSDIHYDYYDTNPPQNRTLRGPRPLEQSQQRNMPTWPKFPKREPRMPINVVVPTRKRFVPPAPTVAYVYPPPKPSIERKGSKTEILLNEEPIPLPAPSSSTKTFDDEEEVVVPSPKPLIHKKKLPPRPTTQPKVTKKQVPVPVTYYSTDEEEENDNDIDEEVLRREFQLSRRKSVHDITISDDDEEDDEEEEEQVIVKPTVPTNNKTIPSRQAHLPPIPQISAPDYSSNNRPKETSTPPPVTTTKCNDLPPIPIISAPGYSSDEDDMPPIPTICCPGNFSDDEDVETKRQEKKKDSIYNSLYFGVRCGGCEEPLSGQAITTSGKHWHTYCFKCQACHQNLEHIAFYEKNGLPYCALDYHELFSPRCDFCKTPIEEHSISALGKTYHAGHFFCRECGKPFDEETNFLEHEGHAYCEKDFYKQFGKSCKGCEETITGDFLVALGGEWHKECFVCADCGATFASSTFLIKGGKPYCEEHYHKQNTNLKKKSLPLPTAIGSKKTPMILVPTTKLDLLPEILPTIDNSSKIKSVQEEVKTCHRCDKSIQGRSLSAFGHDYHPLHFQCSQCNKLLSARVTGLYQEGDNGELICKPCVRKSRLH